MQYVVWGMIVSLILLHQDVWFWTDGTLVFGWMPVGLLYHAGISAAAAFAWYLATRYAWPQGLEQKSEAREWEGES